MEENAGSADDSSVIGLPEHPLTGLPLAHPCDIGSRRVSAGFYPS